MAVQRVTLLGGTGFVGRSLVESWQADEDGELRLLLHRRKPAWVAKCAAEVRVLNLESSASIDAAFEGGGLLVNLLRPDGSGWLGAALEFVLPHLGPAGVFRIVHASSIDVYGNAPARYLDEDSRVVPVSSYEREHRRLELLLADCGLDATVLRLGVVFGTGGQNLGTLAREVRFGAGWKIALRRALNDRRRMHLVAVENVVAAIRLCVRNCAAAGMTLLVTDDDAEDNNFASVQDCFAEALGRHLPAVPTLPSAVLRSALRLRGRSCTDPFRRFSNGRLATLGYRPAIDFDTALRIYCRQAEQDTGEATA